MSVSADVRYLGSLYLHIRCNSGPHYETASVVTIMATSRLGRLPVRRSTRFPNPIARNAEQELVVLRCEKLLQLVGV